MTICEENTNKLSQCVINVKNGTQIRRNYECMMNVKLYEKWSLENVELWHKTGSYMIQINVKTKTLTNNNTIIAMCII